MQQDVVIWHKEGARISDFGKVSVKGWKLFQGSLWAIAGYTGRSCQQLMDNQFSQLVHCAVDAVKAATGFTLSFKQRTVFFQSSCVSACFAFVFTARIKIVGHVKDSMSTFGKEKKA